MTTKSKTKTASKRPTIKGLTEQVDILNTQLEQSKRYALHLEGKLIDSSVKIQNLEDGLRFYQKETILGHIYRKCLQLFTFNPV